MSYDTYNPLALLARPRLFSAIRAALYRPFASSTIHLVVWANHGRLL